MSKNNNVVPGCTSCAPFGEKFGTCNVESVISVDERGQMVLPKELRKQMDIKAGDKLTIVSWKRNGKVASISLFKAEELNELIAEFYRHQ